MKELSQPRISALIADRVGIPDAARLGGGARGERTRARRASPRALALLAAVTALAAPGGARAEEMRHLLDRVVTAYGGRAALQRARVVRSEGTVTSLMHPQPGRMVRLLAQPASLRVEIAYPGAPPEVRVIHGGVGDRDGREVTGTPRAAMVLQAARLALPLALVAEGARVEDRGTVQREGAARRAVALLLPGGLEVVAEVDPRSARIVRSSGSIPTPGGPVEFATDYSDFRRVKGVLFAFREENWARGQHTGATALDRIELLREAPPGAFDERL